MARGTSRQSAAGEKARRLNQALDGIISKPPYRAGFDPMAVSRAALDRLPMAKDLNKTQARKLREGFDRYVADLTGFRERLDPVRDPDGTLDPGNPDTVGRLVVIALLAQERVPLREMNPTYGSGVYAIYYIGQHPAYAEIRGSETPIYVGKADPAEPRAATPRQQGVRLFRRLADHREAIQEVENYAITNGLTHPLRVDDFESLAGHIPRSLLRASDLTPFYHQYPAACCGDFLLSKAGVCDECATGRRTASYRDISARLESGKQNMLWYFKARRRGDNAREQKKSLGRTSSGTNLGDAEPGAGGDDA